MSQIPVALPRRAVLNTLLVKHGTTSLAFTGGCCYHSNRGSSDTNFTYTVKLRPHKRVVWCKCKNCGCRLSYLEASFLLKFANFCYHDNKGRSAETWITAELIDPQNTLFGLWCKNMGPMLNLSGFIDKKPPTVLPHSAFAGHVTSSVTWPFDS